MAITKTMIDYSEASGLTGEARWKKQAEILASLLAGYTGWISSAEYVGETQGNYLTITFTDGLVLSIRYSSSNQVYYTISGMSIAYTLNITKPANSYGLTAFPYCIWETSNGLVFGFNDNNEPMLFITKDQNNNTVVAGAQNLSPISMISSSTSTANLEIVNKNTSANGAVNFYTSHQSSILSPAMTSLAPAVVLGDGNAEYCPNLFIQTFRQYDTFGTINIDGTNYLTNGVFALKD